MLVYSRAVLTPRIQGLQRAPGGLEELQNILEERQGGGGGVASLHLSLQHHVFPVPPATASLLASPVFGGGRFLTSPDLAT